MRRPDPDALVDAVAAATCLGTAPGTIRSWASRGRLVSRGRDRRGRALYRFGDLCELASPKSGTSQPTGAETGRPPLTGSRLSSHGER